MKKALWYKKTDLVAKKLLDKCLNLVKDYSSIILSDEFQVDINTLKKTKYSKNTANNSDQPATLVSINLKSTSQTATALNDTIVNIFDSIKRLTNDSSSAMDLAPAAGDESDI